MMREGWEYKKLGEICSSELGKTLNKSKDKGVLHPYICAINILWDKIDLTTLKETNFTEDEIERYTVKFGDLLVCEGGDTGRAAIWDRKESILYQNALHRLRFSEGVDARFVLYNLWYKKRIGEIDHKYSKGVTILHLVKSALLSIPILIPPKSTQLAIVSELDKINELIRLKKEQLKDFDNLAQSLFYEMFGDPVENEKGWEVKKLGEVYKMKSGDSLSTKSFEEGDIPVYGGNGISGYHNKYNKDGSYIIIGRVGVYCGNVRIVKGRFWLTDNAFELLYDNSSQNEVFVCSLLTHLNLRQYANAAAQPVISNNTLKHVSIPLPPLPLQHLFAHRIDQIEHQKAEVQKAITDLETLLASRMQYWFE